MVFVMESLLYYVIASPPKFISFLSWQTCSEIFYFEMQKQTFPSRKRILNSQFCNLERIFSLRDKFSAKEVLLLISKVSHFMLRNFFTENTNWNLKSKASFCLKQTPSVYKPLSFVDLCSWPIFIVHHRMMYQHTIVCRITITLGKKTGYLPTYLPTYGHSFNLSFLNGPFFFIFVLTANACTIKIVRWLNSNCGPLASEATAQPTEPLPRLNLFC